MVTATSRVLPARRPRVRMTFYQWMTLALVLAVLAGFAPTFYLRPWFDPPPLPSLLVVVHGVVFSGWLLMLLVQTSLVANGRLDLHRRFGIAGIGLAALMLIFGTATAVAFTERALATGLPPEAPPIAFIFGLSMITLIAFGGLVAAAVVLRRRAQVHKRLILLAAFAVSVAGIDRLLTNSAFGALAGPLGWDVWYALMFCISDVFILALVTHDLHKLGRVHAATLWGGLVVLASQALSILVGFAGWFDTLVRGLLG